MININTVLVMTKDGLPLLYQKLNPRATDLEPVLLAGFLQALQLFGNQTINSGRQEGGLTSVDYGKRKLLIYPAGPITIVVLHENTVRAVEELEALLQVVAWEFLRDHASDLQRNVVEPSRYESFRPTLVRLFVDDQVKLAWVPVKLPSFPPSVEGELVDFLDSHRTVEELCQAIPSSNCSQIKRQLNLWWVQGYVTFRNVFVESDILVPKRNAHHFLTAPSPLTVCKVASTSCPASPDSTISCKVIITRLDGKSNLKSLFNNSSCHCLPQVECLWEQGFVEVLTAEKRQILLAKELAGIIIGSLQKHLGGKNLVQVVRTAAGKVNSIDLLADLSFLTEDVIVNFNFRNYDNYPPNELQDLSLKWMMFNSTLIQDIPPKKRKKVVSNLVSRLDLEFFSEFRAEDFDDFEGFTHTLEVLER